MTQWRAVLDRMVEERRSALVGYACLFVPDRRDAEDLVHEAIVRTFSRSRSVTDPHAAEGYVRQAIRTTFLDQARRQRTWRGTMHLVATTGSPRVPEQVASTTLDVRSALALLPPRERACAVLRYFDDLPVADIAAELGISEGAAKRYLSDATRKLRVALGVPGTPDDHADERWTITPVTGRDS